MVVNLPDRVIFNLLVKVIFCLLVVFDVTAVIRIDFVKDLVVAVVAVITAVVVSIVVVAVGVLVVIANLVQDGLIIGQYSQNCARTCGYCPRWFDYWTISTCSCTILCHILNPVSIEPTKLHEFITVHCKVVAI